LVAQQAFLSLSNQKKRRKPEARKTSFRFFQFVEKVNLKTE